jgi:hypothetical protein
VDETGLSTTQSKIPQVAGHKTNAKQMH